MTGVPDGYYAVPDPTAAEPTVTYWRVHTDWHGQSYSPWPAKARYGPVAYRKDVPKDRDAKAEFVRAHWARRAAWMDRIRATIAADPDTCAARFAELRVACMSCGRPLRDKLSKLLGIGPDCRQGLDEAALAAHVTPRVAAAHALRLLNREPEEAPHV